MALMERGTNFNISGKVSGKSAEEILSTEEYKDITAAACANLEECDDY